MSQKAYSAYAQQKYSGLEDASPIKLVGAVLDEIVACLNDAKGAIARNDIPLKGKKLGKAGRLITEALMPGLDLERGGEIAKNLASLYEYCSRKIIEANLKNDLTLVTECCALMEQIRQAWAQTQAQASSQEKG